MSKTPDLSPDAPKVRSITKADIEKREQLLEEARAKEREADSKRSQAKIIDDEIARFVLSKAPKERTISRSGYRLSIVSVAGTVQWAKEFARRLGEKVAQQLRDDAPKRDKLTIEKL